MKKSITNRWLPIGITLLLISAACFAAYLVIPVHIDATGLLHEPFFLLPLGYGGLFASLISFVLALIARPRRQY